MAFRLTVKGICILIAIILAFLFPAYLIDAIRLTDAEKAQEARGKACTSFGCMILLALWLILGNL